jgi:hypothetical protein
VCERERGVSVRRRILIFVEFSGYDFKWSDCTTAGGLPNTYVWGASQCQSKHHAKADERKPEAKGTPPAAAR